MVRFVLRNYAVRSGKAKRFVLRIIPRIPERLQMGKEASGRFDE